MKLFCISEKNDVKWCLEHGVAGEDDDELIQFLEDLEDWVYHSPGTERRKK